MYVKDDDKELSVLVDRSVGGASIKDGELELMLHRLISSLSLLVRLYITFLYEFPSTDTPIS